MFRTPLQQGGDGYQLNFENASLAEVIKVILGDTLKLPYYYDPRVQGQITLSTGRPVTREELLAVLESALKMNNGVLIGSDDGYRIAPAGEAAAGGDVSTVSLNREESLDAGIRRQRAVAAQRLGRGHAAPAREFHQQGRIAEGGDHRQSVACPRHRRRAPVAHGRGGVVRRRLAQGPVGGHLPAHPSTPDELIGELTQTMQAEQGDLVAKMVRFQPIHRLNAVLVLSRQSSHLKMAAEWIRRLDRSSDAGQSLYVYRVENGKAQDLAALLNDTLGTGRTARAAASRSEVAPGRDVPSLSAKATQPSRPVVGGDAGSRTGQRGTATGDSPAANGRRRGGRDRLQRPRRCAAAAQAAAPTSALSPTRSTICC